VVCLQVRGNEAHTLLEHLQWNSRLDARALDTAADRHSVIAVQRAQQRSLAGAVVPVHHPAVARMDHH